MPVGIYWVPWISGDRLFWEASYRETTQRESTDEAPSAARSVPKADAAQSRIPRDVVVQWSVVQWSSFCGSKLSGSKTPCWPLQTPNSKHWFTTSFLQPLPYLVTAIGSRKLSANEQFFVGAQTVVSLLQTTRIKQGVSFIAANKVNLH